MPQDVAPVPARRRRSQLAVLPLLGSVGIGALLLAGAGAATAGSPCGLDGTTLTCSGDLSQGLEFLETSDFDTLVVEALEGDIAPEAASGVKVDLQKGFAVEIDTGEHAIVATGDGAAGIHLSNYAGSGAVSLDLSGNVSSDDGKGIYIDTPGNTASVATGSVSARGDAITVRSNSSGTASVDHTGNITSHEGAGVTVTGAGRVDATTRGVITANGDAINAKSYGNAGSQVTVDHAAGAITSYAGYGIYALSAHDGTTVTVLADISALADGIHARAAGSNGDDQAIVSSTGTIFSEEGYGIFAVSAYRRAEVTSVGNVSSYYDGIYVEAEGDINATASIDSQGTIFSDAGRGLSAESANATVSIASLGAVSAEGDAIYAKASGAIDIDSTGVLTSWSGRGIAATSGNGAIDVLNDGAVEAKLEGIYAKTGGTGSGIDIVSEGAITSWDSRGIHAEAAQGAVDIETTGAISAKKDGIFAKTGASNAGVVINASGGITSWDDRGIWATAAQGSVLVTNDGAIDAKDEGIYAESTGNSPSYRVEVNNTGAIRSWDKAGISASASALKVVVDNTGRIDAKTDGIRATSTGDSVTVTQNGDIFVWDGAGIHAESTAATVSVEMDGDITGGAYGIYGRNEGTDVKIELRADSTISGTGTAGVYLSGITATSFDNYGTVDALAGVVAQSGGWATNTVNNYGTMIGNFDLVAGHNLLNNMAGGTMVAGNTITLNAYGVLTNSGTLSPGGSGTIYTTALTGNFVQTGTGTLLMDVDFDTNGSDRLEVSGTADLAGNVGLVITDIADITPMTFTVLRAGELLGTNLALGKLGNIALDGQIAYVEGTDVEVTVNGVDFSNGGVGASAQRMAGVLSTAYNQGTPGLDPLFTALVNVQTEEEYQGALNQLTPEVYTQSTGSTQAALPGFADRMLSCRVADGAYAFNAEGECVWFSAGMSRLDRDATSESLGYSQTAMTLAVGGQMALSPEIRLGVAGGYVQMDGRNSAGGSSSSDRLQGGVVVKYDRQAMLLAASLTGGIGSTRTTREVSIGQLTETLEGESDNSFLSGRLHAAYTFAVDKAYIRPLADLDVTATHFGALSEAGGVSALEIDAGTQLVASLTPAIEVGAEFAAGDGAVARPYLRAGVGVTTDQALELTARFVEGNGESFTVSSAGDTLSAKLSAGIDLVSQNNATLRFYYDGSFGATATQHGVGMKAGVSF